MENETFLDVDALVRSIGVNREASHAFFLGAGASVTSGIPSANQCIWDWKRSIFATRHPDVEEHYRETTLPAVRDRIQGWLDQQGKYPDRGSDEEYGFYAEEAYPIPDDRRRYFEGLANSAVPGNGYHLLAYSAKHGIVSSVWTTNFDSLAAKAAAAQNVSVAEVGLDSTHRISASVPASGLKHVALHGDYRYDDLRNTPQETQELNERLQEELIRELRETSLIVSGYSGRDSSVRSALVEAYSQSGPGRLYWTVLENTAVPEEVLKLVDIARSQDRDAYVVPISGFDELLTQIAIHCLEGSARTEVDEFLAETITQPHKRPRPFKVNRDQFGGLLKGNLFQIDLPTELLQVPARGYDSEGAWGRLKDRVRDRRDVVAGLLKGQVLALGLPDTVREIFHDQLDGSVERTPITDRDLALDGVVREILLRALTQAIGDSRPGIEVIGKGMLAEATSHQKFNHYGTSYHVFSAVLLRISRYQGESYLTVKPTIQITDTSGDRAPKEVERDAKRKILTSQYNRQFNDDLTDWRDRIFQEKVSTFDFPANSASSFKFTIDSVPAFAELRQAERSREWDLREEVLEYASQTGALFPEPELQFRSRSSTEYKTDPHPIRGLKENRPYDYALTEQGLADSVEIGIVCPDRTAQKLATFLSKLHRRQQPSSKKEYLLEYPGFADLLHVPLKVAEPGLSGWQSIAEPDEGTSTRRGARELSRNIRRAIEQLASASPPDVIIVFVPDNWKEWESYEQNGEHFDLHDFTKAYCVQQGIATQFLREETIEKRFQGEVIWWLALSMYVKAGRTPWTLEGLTSDTAFVGLGFSLDPAAELGKHVLLGCSHIYSSEGLGLSYRLSMLPDSRMRGRGQNNPFLSRGDARRMGEATRQLFFDARRRLPNRVVIHKRTPFRDREKEGFLEGLGKVGQVEMLEITIDPMVRYVASRPDADGEVTADAYPVARGSAIVLEENRALLWVHGAAPNVAGEGRRPYYQGKSRIPAPLVLTRHHGESELSIVAREILGLSKMNWNTFDYYKKMPATIESSNRIARIGRLLNRFSPATFDYRLFI